MEVPMSRNGLSAFLVVFMAFFFSACAHELIAENETSEAIENQEQVAAAAPEPIPAETTKVPEAAEVPKLNVKTKKAPHTKKAEPVISDQKKPAEIKQPEVPKEAAIANPEPIPVEASASIASAFSNYGVWLFLAASTGGMFFFLMWRRRQENKNF
jgi:hypothetical protein